MTNLKCDVTNCVHNCSRLCDLKEVSVAGDRATNSVETCCASFKEATGATNSTHDSNAVPETSINCSAHNCTHNENCKCHADSINVCTCGCSNSSSSKDGTQCSSFCEC